MKHLKGFKLYENSSYPTLDEVENASPSEIMSWNRFLSSPENKDQSVIINRIFARYKELKDSGDINSNTSKHVGWGN